MPLVFSESLRSSSPRRRTGMPSAGGIPSSSPGRSGASRARRTSSAPAARRCSSTRPSGLWGWNAEWEEGLLPAMAEEGVAPEDVDVVFLTHLHIDHVGWNTDRDGELVFPSARYVTHRDGVASARGSERPHIVRAVAPVPFEEVAGETELAEGVTAFDIIGHFPGHMGLRIE